MLRSLLLLFALGSSLSAFASQPNVIVILADDLGWADLGHDGSKIDTPLIISNCSELWACAFRNWGAIRGTRKLIAHQGENMWGCYDVATDPGEEKRLDVGAECADLLPLVEGTRWGKHPW